MAKWEKLSIFLHFDLLFALILFGGGGFWPQKMMDLKADSNKMMVFSNIFGNF